MEKEELCYYKYLINKKNIETLIASEASCKPCDGYNAICPYYIRGNFVKNMLEGKNESDKRSETEDSRMHESR